MNKFFTLLFLFGVLTFSFGGCYTILVHPDTGEGYTSRDYQDACVDCHTDYNEYPYGYFYGDHYPDYWWSAPRFGHYYAYPWWWDYYWSPSEGYYGEDDNGGDNGNFVPRTSTGQKAVRRGSGSMRPPYVQDPDMPATIPNITRGGSSGGTRGSTTKESTGNTGSGSNDNAGSNNNQDNSSNNQATQEKDTKKTRRGGGRK